MDHRPFLDFCAAVTRQLRCRWEAEDVYQELYDHLQDHADALEERGLPPEEAQLQAMFQKETAAGAKFLLQADFGYGGKPHPKKEAGKPQETVITVEVPESHG